jgi:DNA-directed RNA polymerase specialized sigma24 family protein
VSSARAGAVRAAVAALQGDRREVIEGYFLRSRSLIELGDELALDQPDVVALRDEALHALRRTLAPVLADAAQSAVSSSESSGTGSPRTLNLR